MIVKLSLSGLKCKGCVAKVRKKLEEAGAIVKGISLKELEMEIPEGEKIEKFIEIIRKEGYDAKLES
ncbi:MAG: heavy metal-associated domain-containing protein [Archaeoglobaceae archaeon]|nr:heavy metal-associated domain-containing protein [Archaeoglobales archaeon]